MKAIKLKELLNKYPDEELQNIDIRVFSTRYINMGEMILVDSIDVTECELQVLV